MLRIFFLAVFSLFPASLLRAQGYPTQVREDEPALREKARAEAEKAAAEAQKRVIPAPEAEVAYEDILARPDDIELNFRFAKSQVRRGELRLAAATLERILMVNPNLPKVRLFYAVVLFRLDVLEDAQRELNVLKTQSMPDSLRAELNSFLAEIQKRRRKIHFSLSLGAGLDYDTNRNAAPASGQRLLADIPQNLDSDSTHKSDTAKIMLAGLSASYDPGFQAGHQVFASYNYYRAEQTNIRTLNLQSHSASAGLLIKTKWLDITPSYEASHVLLTQTTYLRSHGPRLSMSRQLLPRLGAAAHAGYQRQVYNRTLIVTVGPQRTGDKIEGGVSLSYIITPNLSAGLGFTHVNQGALEKFNAYRREATDASVSWLLGKGQFLLALGTINVDRYEEAEAAISALVRQDSNYRGRLTYGAPLSLIAKPLDDFIFTLSYEYYHSFSNIRNYSYANNKTSGLLTYKWGM